MHQTAAHPISRQYWTLVGLTDTPDGYLAKVTIDSSDISITVPLKSLALQDDLIAYFEPKTALEIGFYLGLESSR